MRTLSLAAILMFALSMLAQGRASTPTPKAEIESVYYHGTWEQGEIKKCITYSGGPHLLACDNDNIDWETSFYNLIASNSSSGKPDEHSYHRAFIYATEHSKKFLVQFSQDAWPKPQEGIKMASWKCSKEKTVTCKFSGREK